MLTCPLGPRRDPETEDLRWLLTALPHYLTPEGVRVLERLADEHFDGWRGHHAAFKARAAQREAEREAERQARQASEQVFHSKCADARAHNAATVPGIVAEHFDELAAAWSEGIPEPDSSPMVWVLFAHAGYGYVGHTVEHVIRAGLENEFAFLAGEDDTPLYTVDDVVRALRGNKVRKHLVQMPLQAARELLQLDDDEITSMLEGPSTMPAPHGALAAK